MDTDQEDQLYKFLQPQGAGMIAPSISGEPSPPPAGGGNPPPPPTDMAGSGEQAAMSGQDSNEKIADSHPGLQPGALDQYIQGQESQVDRWGPEKQAALMEHLQKSYKSPGAILAKGGATLADAIMQGVARAGNPGNLAAINEREDKTLNRAAEMGKSLQEQNLAGIKEKEGLESQSPNTALGGANLPAIQAVARMYKMEPAQVQAMMKSNPQTALKLLDQVGQFATGQMKAQIEQTMKLLEIQVQQSNAQAMQGIAREGKQTEAQKVKQEGLKEVANHPFLHPVNAWKANEEMANGVAGSAQPQKIGSRAQFDALLSGTQFVDDSGKVKTKK